MGERSRFRASLIRVGLGVTLLSAGYASAESLEHQILTPVGQPAAVLQLKTPSNHVVTPEIREEHLDIVNQLPGLRINRRLSFDEFMRDVEQANLLLAAQRFNGTIARARLVAAGVYPDPTFQGGYSADVSGEDQGDTYSFQLSQEVVVPGKIGNRVAAAQAGVTSSDAGLADYWRNLRATAANSFIDGIAQILIIQRKIEALQRAAQLVDLNTKTLKAKHSSEDNLLRAKVGELEARSDLLTSELTLRQTLAGLNLLMGQRESEGLVLPQGNLDEPERKFVLDDLVNHAVTSRSDVLAARAGVEAAKAQYRLARANLVTDPTVSGMFTHNSEITNRIDPAPRWNSLGIQVSLPIPLSDLNSGAREAAYYAELQSEHRLKAVELQAENDVRTAYDSYRLTKVTEDQFGNELLDDATSMYKERLFKLEKGLVVLTDVLDAHATLNQLYLDYYNALDANAKALVALEQAAGIWDISF